MMSSHNEEILTDEYESPAQVYHRLLELVSNETSSPELLPYEETVVDCIVDQIEHMTENMKRLQSKLDPFCIEQHKIELERFGYAVNKYLRTRIEKIELLAGSLIQLVTGDVKLAAKLMSRHEVKYLDNYVSSIDTYLNDSVLSSCNIQSQSQSHVTNCHLKDIPVDEKSQFDNEYVFVRALKHTQIIVEDVGHEEVIECEKGSQHFLPYSAVRRHLVSGSRDLLLI